MIEQIGIEVIPVGIEVYPVPLYVHSAHFRYSDGLPDVITGLPDGPVM